MNQQNEIDASPLLPVVGRTPSVLIDEDDGAFVELETSRYVRSALRGLGIRRGGRAGLDSSGRVRNTSTIKDGAMTSLDYSLYASAVNISMLRARSSASWATLGMLRLMYCFAIGCSVALLATFIIFCTKQLVTFKLSFSLDLAAGVWASFGAQWGLSMAFALISATIVSFIEPLAGGSGLPELKSFLNGVNMPRLMRAKTLIAKLIALPLAIASGLPVGYEGPMVHIGAALACGLTQGKTTLCGVDVSCTKASSSLLRLDSEKRDFVCAGAAAGLSAAFNAPAGAVLFVLEEAGAGHWRRGLLWRAFFTSVTSAYVIDFVLSGLQRGDWGHLTASGMFTFGVSTTASQAWGLWEVPIFALIGALGGAFGALFVSLNGYLLSYRLRNVVQFRSRRVAEVVFLAGLVSLLAFFTPYFLGVCQPLPAQNPGSGDDDDAKKSDATISLSLVQFNCAPGDFNDLASLWLTSPENSIRTLFHMSSGSLSVPRLGIFALLYFLSMCLVSGAAIPAGLFIPSLLLGSAMGRAIGEFGYTNLPKHFLVRAGTYAVIGAAALLGGVMRMSLSLTVILLEATGNSFLALPIMVSLIVARSVGDFFGEGIYDMAISKFQWPVLGEEVSSLDGLSLRASDVMIAPPLVVHEFERAGAVHDTLLHSAHSGFPVIFRRGGRHSSRLGSLAGYIQRRHLAVLLEQRAFQAHLPWAQGRRGSGSSAGGGSMTGGGGGGGGGGGMDVGPYDPNIPRYTSLSALGALAAVDPLHSSINVNESYRARVIAGTARHGLAKALDRSPLPPPPSLVTAQILPPLSRSNSSNNVRIRTPSSLEVHHTVDDALAIAEANVESSFDSIGSNIGILNRPLPLALGGGGDLRSAAAITRMAQTGSAEALSRLAATSPAAGMHRSASENSLGATIDLFSTKENVYEGVPPISAEVFNAFYPRFPDPRAIALTPTEREMWLDLRPYFDSSPVTVQAHAPLERVHKLFTCMGLRHLLVINDAYDCVGVITRHDLAPFRIEAIQAAIRKRLSSEEEANK